MRGCLHIDGPPPQRGVGIRGCLRRGEQRPLQRDGLLQSQSRHEKRLRVRRRLLRTLGRVRGIVGGGDLGGRGGGVNGMVRPPRLVGVFVSIYA